VTKLLKADLTSKDLKAGGIRD